MATQAQLASIVESSIDGIIEIDLNGSITSWNKGAENIFGFEGVSAVGKNFANFIFFKDPLAQEKTALAALTRGETMSQARAFGVTQQGVEISVSVPMAPVYSAAGKVVGASITGRDTTEQMQAETRILELNSNLEQQDAQRTEQLELARRNLQTLLDAAPSLIDYWDKHLVNRVANRAYQVALFDEQVPCSL